VIKAKQPQKYNTRDKVKTATKYNTRDKGKTTTNITNTVSLVRYTNR